MNFVKASLACAAIVVLSCSVSFAQAESAGAVANAAQAIAATNPAPAAAAAAQPAKPAAPKATYLTRQQIRSLPITQRPNRPGHFIGNSVRRRAAR